jgi:hypothetical protein
MFTGGINVMIGSTISPMSTPPRVDNMSRACKAEAEQNEALFWLKVRKQTFAAAPYTVIIAVGEKEVDDRGLRF